MSDADKTSKTDETETGTHRDGNGDKQNPANSQPEATERLDEALEETFPSSDPVSVKITK